MSKTINFPFVPNGTFLVLGVQVLKNIILICLNFGTPKNNKFSIWDKWKIHYLTEVIIIIGVLCITEWFKWGIPDFTSRDLTWLGLLTSDQGFPDLSPAGDEFLFEPKQFFSAQNPS